MKKNAGFAAALLIIIVLIVLIAAGILWVRYYYLPSITSQNSAPATAASSSAVAVQTSAPSVDLQLQSVNVPQNENAYYAILVFSGSQPKIKLYEPSNVASETAMIGGQWNKNFAQNIMTRNQAAFPVIDQAFAMQYYQDPATAKAYSADFMPGTVPYATLGELQQIGRIEGIRALYLFKQGKQQDGLNEAMKLIAFGDKIDHSQVDLIQHLVARAMKLDGLWAMQTMIRETNLPKSSLVSYISQLTSFADDTTGLVTAFKAEYMKDTAVVDYVGTRTSIVFDPIKTKQGFADWWSYQIDQTAKNCDAITGTKPQPASVVDFLKNLTGAILSPLEFDVTSAQQARCFSELALSATRIMIALKTYYLDHQNYPSTLDALVPSYIASVPMDPYDGNSMRYNAANKIIYSVGNAGKDLGGSTVSGDWGVIQQEQNPTFGFR